MTERRRVVLPLVVGLALVTIAVAAALSGGQVHRLAGSTGGPSQLQPAAPRPAVPSPLAQASSPPATAAGGRSFDWVLLVLLAVVAVAVIVAVAVVVLRLSRRGRGDREPADAGAEPGEEPSAAERASLAVRSGLADLGAPGSDPRGVVIGCWLALERAAAAVGLPRRDTDSPTDLVTRLLAGAEVPAAVLGDLAALYRAARYAPDDVTDSSREAARQALTQVALALQRGATDRVGAVDREPAGTAR